MTDAEREELVVFNWADSHAVVYSHSPRVWKACRRASGVEKRAHKHRGKLVALEYNVPLEYLDKALGALAEIARKKASKIKG